jgi:hypothetical protein
MIRCKRRIEVAQDLPERCVELQRLWYEISVRHALRAGGTVMTYAGRDRLHTALDGRTPDQAYFDPLPLRTAA